MEPNIGTAEKTVRLYVSPSKNARPMTAAVSSKTKGFFKERKKFGYKSGTNSPTTIPPTKGSRAPLLFRKSDGTMYNLASSGNDHTDTESLLEAIAADDTAARNSVGKSPQQQDQQETGGLRRTVRGLGRGLQGGRVD